jgi:hypothetical protein
MQAEDLVLDKSGEREEIEEIGEVLPDVCVSILAETLVVKAVDLSDLTGFVVATKDGYALGVADFEGNEQGDGLDGEIATVNVIACQELAVSSWMGTRSSGGPLTHEEVVRIWIWPANLEQLHEVVKLAVYVATDGDRAFLRNRSAKV